MTGTAPESPLLGHRYVTSDLTTVAPHVRSPLNVRRALHCTLLASLPCVAMSLYNTGYQANLALAELAATGWRPRLLATLGATHSPANVFDCVAFGLLCFAPLLAAAWLAGGASEWCFARARGRRPDHRALPVIAVLLTLSLPATLPLWQAALAAAIGVVIGKEIFGGIGRNFVNPVVVGLAFLYFAYPGSLGGDAIWVPVAGHQAPTPLDIATRSGLAGLDTRGLTWAALALGRVPGALGGTSALACLMGAGVLLYTGVASWRVVAGGVTGLLAGVLLLQGLDVGRPIASLPWHWHLVTGGFAFGIVYLATDPVTAATTNPGRWLYGALIGAFVAVIRIANPAHHDGVVMALLFGNVTAPLIDRIVAYAQLRRGRMRGRRHA